MKFFKTTLTAISLAALASLTSCTTTEDGTASTDDTTASTGEATTTDTATATTEESDDPVIKAANQMNKIFGATKALGDLIMPKGADTAAQ